jgi:hypothetical protein
MIHHRRDQVHVVKSQPQHRAYSAIFRQILTLLTAERMIGRENARDGQQEQEAALIQRFSPNDQSLRRNH